jgi:hypothetical protein
MFAEGSVQATFARISGAFPVESALGKGQRITFQPSGFGKATNAGFIVGCVAVVAVSPWMIKDTFKGVRQFTGGIHWALLVAAVSSVLAVAGGLVWAFRNKGDTAQLFTVS